MIAIGYRRVINGLFLLAFCMVGVAQPGPGPGMGYQCSGCTAEYPGALMLAEVLGDLLDVPPETVSVVPGQDVNVYTISLPDGTLLSVTPVGPAFRYQNAVQSRLQQTEQGGFRLRSRSRVELQIRSAIHREAELVAELLRLGWTNFYWFEHGLEMDSPAGARYCFKPDIILGNAPAPGDIELVVDVDGYLVVTHPDGIQQRLHACAHDFFQLRDQVRAAVQQQLMLNTDGTFQLLIGEENLRFRLNAQLAWTDELDQPGFYTDGDRILLRYRDGWAQEVVLLD